MVRKEREITGASSKGGTAKSMGRRGCGPSGFFVYFR
jgi:hypothetical protein